MFPMKCFHLFCSVIKHFTFSTLFCPVASISSVPLKVTGAKLPVFHRKSLRLPIWTIMVLQLCAGCNFQLWGGSKQLGVVISQTAPATFTTYVYALRIFSKLTVLFAVFRAFLISNVQSKSQYCRF